MVVWNQRPFQAECHVNKLQITLAPRDDGSSSQYPEEIMEWSHVIAGILPKFWEDIIHIMHNTDLGNLGCAAQFRIVLCTTPLKQQKMNANLSWCISMHDLPL